MIRKHWAFATWRAAFRESWSQRGAFIADVSVMCLNDFIWLGFWAVFFHNTGTVRGWNVEETFVFFAVATAAFGLLAGFFSNVRKLGQLIANGELDAALTVPVDTLVYLCVRKINPSNIGDGIFGIVLFLAVGNPTPGRIALFLAVITLGAVVMASFMVLLGSLTFFAGGDGQQSQFGFEMTALFSMYPIDFFGGLTKVMLFTVVPTAFMTGVPTRIITEFSWADVGLLTLVAASLATLARLTFNAGLRRYRSGAAWTSA